MSVRFVVLDHQLKLLKHGLQSLHKIGSELLLEALPARIVLRTINSSLSAYLSVAFNASFFDSFEVVDCDVVQAGLLMKHVLSVFRTQKVGKLLFDLDTARCKATVTLFCDNGLVKSYTLTTMDAEILQATVDKQQFAVRITAETSAISRLLSSFDAGLEEVTVVALPDGSHRPVHINSFIDPLQGFVGKSLYTSVQLDPTETFLAYVNSSDEATDVTINLKDLKAILSLCENLGTNMKLCFDSPGNPLVAEPHFPQIQAQFADCEAELILSTLLESHGDAVPGLDGCVPRNDTRSAPGNLCTPGSGSPVGHGLSRLPEEARHAQAHAQALKAATPEHGPLAGLVDGMALKSSNHLLGGDAAPMEVAVSRHREPLCAADAAAGAATVPSSPPHDPVQTSTLAPGALV